MLHGLRKCCLRCFWPQQTGACAMVGSSRWGLPCLHREQILLEVGHAFDAHNRAVPCGSAAQREAVAKAQTAGDMYQARPGVSQGSRRLDLIGWVNCRA